MILILALLFNSLCLVDDWPQFRGVNSSGIAVDDIPVEFGPGQKELWHIDIGPGHSSPVVVGDSIFLTTFDKARKQLSVVRIAKSDGKIIRTRSVTVGEFEKWHHPSFNPASSTVACDDECVVAYFGSFGLICFDFAGEERWRIEMPPAKSYAGNAASPMIAGDKVILYRGNQVDHFLLAVNKKTGDGIWKVPQDEPFAMELACTSCPIIKDNILIAHTARSVQAFDVNTGERIWVTKCATTATSTPVLAGDEVIVAAWNKMGEPALRPKFPSFEELVQKHDDDENKLISRDEFPKLWIFHRPEGAEAPQNGAPMRFQGADKNKDGEIDVDEWNGVLKGIAKFREGYKTHGLLAIPINSKGVVGSGEVRTLATRAIPEVPSPLVHDGIVYCVKNSGLLSCIELKTGELLSKVRTRGKGTHYASPIISGNRLYSTAGDGTISVLSLGPKPKILAVNKMDGRTYATPAVSDSVLFVRTHKRLYAFAKN